MFFFGFELWQQAQSTGADLLWRMKKNMRMACEKRLPDGSYLSQVYPSDLHVFLRLRVVAAGAEHRRGPALEDEEEHAHGLRKAPARWFLFEPSVSFAARLAAENQRRRPAGDRLPP